MGEDRKKVLVIDDEEDICFLVKDNLEQAGKFEVVTTTNPLEAEAICLREKPDLLLLDVVMPERKGSDIAASLKKDPLTQGIPIIIMSGLGEMVYQQNTKQWKWMPNRPVVFKRGEVVHEKNPDRAAQAYGVDYYISKPFTTDQLLEAIKKALP